MIKSATLRTLLSLLTLAAILPVSLLLAYALYNHAEQRVEEAKYFSRTLAMITAADVGSKLAENRDMLQRLASRPAIREVNAANCDQVLWTLREIFPKFANATTVDMQGIATCSAVPQPGGKPVNVSKAAWFKRSIAEKTFVVSDPFFGPITSRWVSVLTYPIRDEQNKMIGMLGFPVDLALFTPSISTASLIPGTSVSIISAQGTMVWHNSDAEKWVGKNVKDQATIQRILAIKQGDLEATGIDGTDRLYSVSPVAGADWYVYVGVPTDAVFAETRAALLRNVILGVAVLLCLGAFVLFVSRQINHPVKSLLLTVKEVKHGNREVKAEPIGPPEIVEVAEEFNKMLDVRRMEEQRLETLLAEQKLTESKLAQSKSELERFAEVTAHHLQEPARRMASYAERLSQQLGAQIKDEEARLSLEFIGQQGQRQLSLLRDVERYLESNQPRGKIVSVDANNAVSKLLTDWKNRISAAGAAMTLGHLPPARIDLPRFNDVFSIALDNALSHGGSDHPLKIAIDGEIQGNKARYSISDNGPGVEEQYRERVFRVFERLAPKRNVAGTGIGLAILRRIVEDCDGHAWIEEAPEGGCRLLFELPAGKIGDAL
ncbi:MAG: cache domain-containing protein [Sterolibacterium sp.]